MTRILHTADWHLGARLVENDRIEEHRLFLRWLLETVEKERPDVLLVAGDVFDTSNPPQSAVQLYFEFLAELQRFAPVRVIVTGGNHDSPLTLNAPAGVLRRLDVHVHGCPPETLDNCFSEYTDAVVCAVPYLRERDVRIASAGQSSEAVAAEIRQGIAAYYKRVLERGREIAGHRALVTSGHLTVLGSVTSDSEREIHIGNLGAVDAACFDGFDYVALGHLHRPQQVGASPFVRYSGSPLPLSFDDSGTEKSVVLAEFKNGSAPAVTLLPIPRFRLLARVSSTAEALRSTFASLRETAGRVSQLMPWLELTLTAADGVVGLEREIRDAAEATGVVVLKALLASRPHSADAPASIAAERSLAQMPEQEVFTERLRAAGIDPSAEEGVQLTTTFVELLSRMNAAERETQETTR